MKMPELPKWPESGAPIEPPAHLRPIASVPEWETAFRAAGGLCPCAGECKVHFGRCYKPGMGPAARRFYLTTSLTGAPIVVCDECMSGRERIIRRGKQTAAKQRKADEPTLF